MAGWKALTTAGCLDAQRAAPTDGLTVGSSERTKAGNSVDPRGVWRAGQRATQKAERWGGQRAARTVLQKAGHSVRLWAVDWDSWTVDSMVVWSVAPKAARWVP
jgi:hypothetical protein